MLGAIAALTVPAGGALAAKAQPTPEVAEATAPRGAGEPIMAIVSIKSQQVTFYDADGWIYREPVSTGVTGRETPAGIFAVLEKDKDHHSSLYDDARMPNMQRLTWNGIALHGGPLPGYAASHGCVRMPFGFAEKLFPLTRIGMRVIVSPNDAEPVELSHPALFEPNAQTLLAAPALAETLAREATDAGKAADEDEKAATKAARDAASAAASEHKLEGLMTQADAQLASAGKALDAAKTDQAKLHADDLKLQAALKDADAAMQQDTAQANTTRDEAAAATDAFQAAATRKADAAKSLAAAKSNLAKAQAEDRKAKAGAQAAEATAQHDSAMEVAAQLNTAAADAKPDASAGATDAATAAVATKAETVKAEVAKAEALKADAAQALAATSSAEAAAQAADQEFKAAAARAAEAKTKLDAALADAKRDAAAAAKSTARAAAAKRDAAAAARAATRSDQAEAHAEDLQAKATTKAADASTQLDNAKADAKLKADAAAATKDAAKVAAAKRLAIAKAAIEAKLQLEPVSVYISRATQKLYVRRNTHKPWADGGEVFDTTMEVPVTIRDPDKPIGTHVFTAMARNEAGLRWSVVTIDDADDAKDALDRITFPQDVLDRVAPTALPRSSIVVSDEPLSHETNFRTEFVAVLSSQPQGGFKTRTPTAEVHVASGKFGGSGSFGLFNPPPPPRHHGGSGNQGFSNWLW